MSGPVEGALRVWWIPQVPMDPFLVNVSTIDEAIKIIRVLSEYDLFQYENKVKPDYFNLGGLDVFENGEWFGWESADGDDIVDVMRELEIANAGVPQ